MVILSIVLILLVFIGSASAADANETGVLAVDGSTNAVDEKLALDYSSEVSAVANDSNVIENDGNNLLSADNGDEGNVLKENAADDQLLGGPGIVIITPSDTWYVNASAPYSGVGNETSPFQTIGDALSVAEDGNTIMIASGEYKGTGNVGLSISKNLNFIKYGDGEAIFDAEGNSGIWTVTATSINITGLTFKNGNADNGGAILFDTAVISNSNINATFINNTAATGGAIYTTKQQYGLMNNVNISGKFIDNHAIKYYGGAIYLYIPVSNSKINAAFINSTAKSGGANMFWYDLTNVDITGEFINNSATDSGWESGGGANYFQGKLTNVAISGNFIHNTAEGTDTNDGGGANYFVKDLTDVTITGNYINNTAANKGGALYISKVGGNTFIEDACFINNGGDAIYVNSGVIIANNNWFGNNATNYDTAPADAGITLDNWLFLYVIAGPKKIEVGHSSRIVFEMYSYDGSTVSEYTGPIDIQLDLTQTLGELDKDTASLGEEIIYTAKQVGDAGVTAAFETASYTIGLTNARGPTTLYVNSSKTSSGNGTSDAEAFMSLKEALDNSINGDTIMIAAGEYKGTNNTRLEFDKNLTFTKYGDGEAIFDAEGTGRDIFYVNSWSESKSINVNGLTFKNAFYAIYVAGTANGLVDSTINATFINNSAAAQIYAQKLTNVEITGKFINNPGWTVIYCYECENLVVHDSIFINNSASTIFNIGGSYQIYDNWFGNNATDYDSQPQGTSSSDMKNWLFLNATADPSEIGIGESSKITFKLQSYEGSDVSSYTGPIDIQLDLTQTLGELDKDTASLGEEITYTAKQAGDGSVTATFETASYTINFDLDPRTPTEIKVTNSTLDLKIYDEVAAGATLTPADAGNLTYTSAIQVLQ